MNNSIVSLGRLTGTNHPGGPAFVLAKTDEAKYRYELHFAGLPSFCLELPSSPSDLYIAEDIYVLTANPSVIDRYNSEGILQQRIDLPVPASRFWPMSHGRFLLLAERELYVQNEHVCVIDRLPAFAEGDGFTGNVQDTLAVFDVTTEELTFLHEDLLIEEISVADDNRTLAVLAAPRKTVQGYLTDAFLIDLEEPTERKMLTLHEAFYWTDVYAVDAQRIILIGSDMKQQGLNQYEDIFLWEKDELVKLSPEAMELSLWPSVRSDVRYVKQNTAQVFQDSFYFIATAGERSGICAINLNDGVLREVLAPEGTVDGFCLTDTGIFYILQSRRRAQELCYQSFTGEERRQSSFNAPFTLGTVHRIQQGTVQGEVWLPEQPAAAAQPAVLLVHGGPRLIWGDAFVYDKVSLLEEGFAVLSCNPPGSDGQGRAYSDIRGKYGVDDLAYLHDFLKLVFAQFPAITSQYLGIWGGSYGGFLSAYLCAKAGPVAAACIERPIINWFSFCLQSDIGWYFAQDQLAADLWENPDLYWQTSPLAYVANWKAPTLIIQGDEDRRCPAEQSRQLHAALLLHGIPSELRIYIGADHNFSINGAPEQKADRIQAILAWFKRWLNSN